MSVAVLKTEASHYKPLNKKANTRNNDCEAYHLKFWKHCEGIELLKESEMNRDKR